MTPRECGLLRRLTHLHLEAAMSNRLPALALSLLLWAQLGVAHATLITFDDLPPPDPSDFASTRVTTEYASRGLIVNDGFLLGSGVPGTNQQLLGATVISLTFLEILPSHVSLYVSAPNHDSVLLQASGPGGYGQSFETLGGAGQPETDPPYVPNQYVSFYSATGISGLTLNAYYNLRVGPVIDNLYFGPVPAVPEPGSLALLATGVALIAAFRRSSRGRAGAPPIQ
jgi:hypothetical protein